MERYDIFRVERGEAGEITAETKIDTFTVAPAPAQTLAGRLMELQAGGNEELTFRSAA